MLLLACGSDQELYGDHSFLITQECSEDGTSCEPVCEDIDCDVCEHSQPPSDGGCWITGIGYLIDAPEKPAEQAVETVDRQV